jgi:phytol kinase
MNPWYGIVITIGSLAALLVGCKRFSHKYSLSPELSRKTVHIGMGLICSIFPLLFHSGWPVYFLAVSAVASLIILRSVPFLKHNVGSPLHGVDRDSFGEIYFPVSIALIWFVSHENSLYYSLSILVLAFADAFAALVGSQYGQQRYTTKEGYKTWEGSGIFFTITFLFIHIPLLLFTDVGRAESILIAVLIGILVTIIEAVSWRGLDNFFIPLCVCFFLNIYQGYDAGQILVRVLFLVSVILLLFFVRSRLKLDDASLLGASLVTYLVITVGGWKWGVAPFILFINYLYLGPNKTTAEERVHNIYALLSVTFSGFIWLTLYYRYHQPTFFLPYIISYMAQLICIYIAQWAFEHSNEKLFTITLKSTIVGFLMIMIPTFLLFPDIISTASVLLSLFCAILTGVLFSNLQPMVRDCPLDKERFIRQALIGLLVSLIPWGVLVVLPI